MREQTQSQEPAEERRRSEQYHQERKILQQAGWETLVKPMTDGTFFTLPPKEPEGTLAVMVTIQTDTDYPDGQPNNEDWCKIGGVGVLPDLPVGVDVKFTNTYAVQDGVWVNTSMPEYRKPE